MNSSATIGSLSVLTLTLASDAASRGMLGERAWSAYQRLMEMIRECIGDDEALLDQPATPTTMWTRVSLAIEQSLEYRAKIKDLAVALVSALKADVRRGALGISLRKLDVIQANLEEIS
jgi:hypothetical protein